MTIELSDRRIILGVSASAAWLAAIGVLLLFAPEEAGGALTPARGDGTVEQLLGAALLGFGAMNWVGRRSVLGGIYGRAVVAGNQTHLTIGAILLLVNGIAMGGTVAYWALASLYTSGAIFFAMLLRAR